MNDITNEQFLQAIFGPRWESAHVCGFETDPADSEAGHRRWAGNRYGRLSADERDALRDMNSYFTISLFADDPESGRALRRKRLFRACFCVVIDDVGTKVRLDDTRLLRPSWSLATSPGNFQWGYKLREPEADANRINALLDGLVRAGLATEATDPGMKGVTRYMRLPEGRNRKAKYGPDGFRCRLEEWRL